MVGAPMLIYYSPNPCAVNHMTPEERAAYDAGTRDQRIAALEKHRADHEEKCDARSEAVWAELKSHSKMLYIGFGVLTVLELFILAAGPIASAMMGN